MSGQVTSLAILQCDSVTKSWVNSPPDCSSASPSMAELWPPNHKMVDIGIVGVTDAEGDPITIRILGITQDEPINGLGDGDTSPDGSGVGTSTARVRSERSGGGNGRVYEISFAASDGRGGECRGSVKVCVPHDQGGGRECIDDGQAFDSVGALAPRTSRASERGARNGM